MNFPPQDKGDDVVFLSVAVTARGFSGGLEVSIEPEEQGVALPPGVGEESWLHGTPRGGKSPL